MARRYTVSPYMARPYMAGYYKSLTEGHTIKLERVFAEYYIT